ncbi:MAG TPA: ferredoxin-thioredoxin reductase catalytic domain-containing protein [bacterium]|nr:ferredoxin-thioredoxin reductase catalytic domain-containing protein [bacterium]
MSPEYEEPEDVSEEEVDAHYAKLADEAGRGGYNLNPDSGFTRDLVRSLIINERRYGYRACPCRLADGEKEKDLDIICPCDYRDPDVEEWGACYCALYVSRAVVEGTQAVEPVPERRPVEKERIEKRPARGTDSLPYPVWRCRVCGYLCAREQPPGVCPVCKAEKDRFEIFMK